MKLLSLFLLSIVSGVFWVANAETAAMYYSGKLGYNPFLVALVCATGQCSCYTILFLGGDALINKWKWLHSQIEKTKEKYSEKLEERFSAFTALGAVFGLPPMTAMAAIAPSFDMSLKKFLTISFFLRFLRFAFLAAFGRQIALWWQTI